MKVLVTGAGGMLGQALVRELRGQGEEVVGLSRSRLDVLDHAAVETALKEYRPNVVVQCAAYTAVDKAENAQEEAFLLNAASTENIAQACQRWGALLVYPSTDYVFSGELGRPYAPTDPVDPINVYGASKVAGEQAARLIPDHLIVRTSWLYGRGGRNFVDIISEIAASRKSLQVVSDQVGLPTWTGSLSYVIGRLLKVGAVGTFHAADAGEPLCWYEFARRVVKLRGLDPTVILPTSSEEYGALARRPRSSILDCTETEQVIGEPLPNRETSLVEYIASPHDN